MYANDIIGVSFLIRSPKRIVIDNETFNEIYRFRIKILRSCLIIIKR